MPNDREYSKSKDKSMNSQQDKETYRILLEKIGQLNDTITELSVKVNNLKILCNNVATGVTNELSSNNEEGGDE